LSGPIRIGEVRPKVRSTSFDSEGEKIEVIGHWRGGPEVDRMMQDLATAVIKLERWRRLEIQRWEDDGGRIR
jgi:hypothetical protein